MFDYYYGEVTKVLDDRTVAVKSVDFRVENVEVMLPEIMSRRPKVGDMIEYAFSYDARQVRFGIFMRFENESTIYLEDLNHKIGVGFEDLHGIKIELVKLDSQDVTSD